MKGGFRGGCGLDFQMDEAHSGDRDKETELVVSHVVVVVGKPQFLE